MEKSIIAAVLIALGTGTFASAANAGTWFVDKREQRQVQRIWHGISVGELTAHEAGRLWHGQMRIRAAERRFLADGYLNKRERRHLRRMLRRQSRTIYRLKHN